MDVLFLTMTHLGSDLSNDELNDTLEQADKDHDGFLDLSEFLALLVRQKAKLEREA